MSSFVELPQSRNGAGETRRVGVEMEMADIGLADMAEEVVRRFGGTHEPDGAFVHRVVDTRYGEFRMELDSSLLKEREYLKFLKRLGVEVDPDAGLDRILSDLAGIVVPHELVAPPIPWTALEEMDGLREGLRARGARGTHASLLYAFGLQLNIEAARLEADYLRDILRAFILLYEWLMERGGVDLSRRFTPYVNAFPGRYARRILDPDYAPPMDGLIDHYLRDNPTRNRPLDMLPLFAHIDAGRVSAAPVEHHLVKARPTFHYRLPDCRIDEPDWCLAQPWNDWVAVERLAADPVRLEQLSREALTAPGHAIGRIGDRWRGALRDLFGD
ncbi:amidoligase enzyme [Thioalkalivibrio denitrificans]|uniref:Amidoligase enzyme n=1 Tax=Thioalkalivibrio denitrificans TaxID=108003 RepID=A0A1V3NDU3_9GAMM|nr:amidoligase family protein [Thioalkalivibrio denitrificans]OOG23257.1 amidoligase enzyme [Thioalkalivibrio denitrificans]